MARARPWGTTLRVVALEVFLLLLGAGLWALPQTRAPGPHSTGVQLTWWMLALLAGAGESVMPARRPERDGIGVSLSEIALVLGLFLCSPRDIGLGLLSGTAVALLLARVRSGLQAGLSLAMVFASAGLARLIFQLVDGARPGIEPVGWLAAGAASAGAALLAAGVVGAVPVLADPIERWRRLRRHARHEVLASVPATLLALAAVQALAAGWQAAPLLAASYLLLLLGYRAHAQLLQRHLGLEQLHRFSQAVSNSPEVEEILAGVLQHARQVLRADHAEVIFVSSQLGQLPLRIATAGHRALERSRLSERDAASPTWAGVLSGSPPLLMARGDRDARQFLAARGLRDAVLVALHGEAGIVGTLMVADRIGEARSFDEDDVQLLVTVANHTSMALQNGRLVDRLRHDSLHDGLTGLANRALLTQQLTEALHDVEAARSPGLSLLVLNLSGFKQVNDTFGHQLGDRLLQEVGRRITGVLAGRGLLARLGGDEFAALLPGVANEAVALDVAARIRESLERPIVLTGVDVEVGISIGLALAPAHGQEGPVLLKRADLAMYEAKHSGAGVHVYEPGDEVAETPQRLALIAQLRSGIAEGQVEVFVQPQACLRTGEVLGAEALVRWRHPRLGLLAPDTFIPLAERSGLIRQLTDEVLRQGVAACGGWHSAGHSLSISVNLSARGTFSDDLVGYVRSLLAEHAVPPEALTLEITESSVIEDPARTRSVLEALHGLGVGLSLDDFGTGYSSMSYLRLLPVQEVKIDKSFVLAMLTSPQDAAIVRSVVDLGSNLGMSVVAEGVEDVETWAELDRLGCDIAQGYLVARPMPLAEFPGWLATHPLATHPLATLPPADRPPATQPVSRG